MPNIAALFRLLNELILLLLGGLLVLLAVTGRAGLGGRPTGFVLLGGILIYWGLRGWMRRGREKRPDARLRAGSLVLVGLLILGIPLFSLRQAQVLLEIAGAVLAIRGLFGSLLALRRA